VTRDEPRTFANASRSAVPAQQLPRGPAGRRQADQQVLGRDVLVAHLRREPLGGGDGGQRVARQLGRRHRRARRGRQPLRELGELRTHGPGVGADRGEQRRGDAVALGEQGAEQVHRPDVGVAGQRRGLGGGGDRLLRLRGGVEGIHPSRPPASRVGTTIVPVDGDNVRKVESVPLRAIPVAAMTILIP
jgi:hypothetical protein